MHNQSETPGCNLEAAAEVQFMWLLATFVLNMEGHYFSGFIILDPNRIDH